VKQQDKGLDESGNASLLSGEDTWNVTKELRSKQTDNLRELDEFALLEQQLECNMHANHGMPLADPEPSSMDYRNMGDAQVKDYDEHRSNTYGEALGEYEAHMSNRISNGKYQNDGRYVDSDDIMRTIADNADKNRSGDSSGSNDLYFRSTKSMSQSSSMRYGTNTQFDSYVDGNMHDDDDDDEHHKADDPVSRSVVSTSEHDDVVYTRPRPADFHKSYRDSPEESNMGTYQYRYQRGDADTMKADDDIECADQDNPNPNPNPQRDDGVGKREFKYELRNESTLIRTASERARESEYGSGRDDDDDDDDDDGGGGGPVRFAEYAESKHGDSESKVGDAPRRTAMSYLGSSTLERAEYTADNVNHRHSKASDADADADADDGASDEGGRRDYNTRDHDHDYTDKNDAHFRDSIQQSVSSIGTLDTYSVLDVNAKAPHFPDSILKDVANSKYAAGVDPGTVFVVYKYEQKHIDTDT
jgi:hypothetical protein